MVIEVCVHHWMCEPNGQPESKAVCKLCGEVRTFANWVEQPYESYLLSGENALMYNQGKSRISRGY